MDRQSTPAAGQDWSAPDYARHAGFVPKLGRDVLALLDPQADESILDLGCGDGHLTAEIAARGARTTGLEPDRSMARAARARGITVLEQDAHDPFGEGCFDAVFSNAALHWMRDPDRVIANAHRALRPGGRFVAEQGGFGNVAAVVTALRAGLTATGHPIPEPGPWDFPSVEQKTARLEAAGFAIIEIALLPRPTPLPTGISGWLETFAAPYLAAVPEARHEDILAQTEQLLPALKDPHGGWWADYVRLRFSALKPE